MLQHEDSRYLFFVTSEEEAGVQLFWLSHAWLWLSALNNCSQENKALPQPAWAAGISDNLAPNEGT